MSEPHRPLALRSTTAPTPRRGRSSPRSAASSGCRRRSAGIVAPCRDRLLALAAWEAIVRIKGIPPYILPGPLLIAQTLVDDWADAVGIAAGSRCASPSRR